MKCIGTILLAASGVWGADVTLRITEAIEVPAPVLYLARAQVTRMYAVIGVRLDWKTETARTISEGPSIRVMFTAKTPGHPNAMAFSNPFDTAPVVTVMYDRILSNTERAPEIRSTLLAHVMAHEIGHLLMKSDSHSPEGVMKAYLTISDYSRMAYRPLPFLPDDVDLILRGLKLMSAER